MPIVPAAAFRKEVGRDDYAAWLYEGDWVIGKVLEALESHHLADRTLVIATSDNGANQRVYPPLRGCKRTIYEGGHRVPFLARWPGKIKAGSVSHDPVCLNDLMATCAEILEATLPPDAGEDSVSILPDLLGVAKGPVRETTVHQSPAGDLAIREGSWKLIFFRNGQRELYNLRTDPSEGQEIARHHPDVVERLATRMQQQLKFGRSTPGPTQKNAVEVMLDRRQ